MTGHSRSPKKKYKGTTQRFEHCSSIWTFMVFDPGFDYLLVFQHDHIDDEPFNHSSMMMMYSYTCLPVIHQT